MTADSTLHSRFSSGYVYYGWIVVAACFLASTTTFGVIYSFNVFVDPIVAQYATTAGTASLLFSFQSVVTFGFAMVFGFFVDAYGARRLLAIAALLIGGGLALVSRAGSFLVLAGLYGFVVSTGLGVTFIVAYATVPRWFDRRRGIATAVAVSGSGIGIILGPPVANALIGTVGWQEAYLFIGLLAFVAVALAAVLIADSPASVGVDPSVEFPADERPGVDGDSRDWREQLADVFAVVRKPGLLAILFGFTLMYVPAYVVLVHVVSHLTDLGIEREVAVLAASAIGAMNILGKYVFGAVADRVGELRSIIACCLLVSVGTVGYVLATSLPIVVVVTLLFGLGYGGSAVLMSPIVARFFGQVDLNTLTGTVSTGFAVSGSLAPFVAGRGYEVFGSYTVVLVASGVVGLCGAVAFAFARRTTAAVAPVDAKETSS